MIGDEEAFDFCLASFDNNFKEGKCATIWPDYNEIVKEWLFNKLYYFKTYKKKFLWVEKVK
jgi:hypothetical protein